MFAAQRRCAGAKVQKDIVEVACAPIVQPRVADDIDLVDARVEVRPPLLMSPSREGEREHKLSREGGTPFSYLGLIKSRCCCF